MSLFGRGGRSFLPDADYVPLAMPTTDLGLLRVLVKEGDVLRRFGRLADVLTAPAPLPGDACLLEQPTSAARGSVTRAMSANQFGSLLLAGLGGRAGLDLSVTGARTVEYTYTDVTADTVHLAALDGWLGGAVLGPGVGRVSADLLVAGRLFVVSAVLKAGTITSSLRGHAGADLAVEVPVVQDLVGGALTVNASAVRASTLTFAGPQPLVIAAKAVRVQVDETGFWVGSRPDGAREVRGLPARAEVLRVDELVFG